jgi:DinB superfamily
MVHYLELLSAQTIEAALQDLEEALEEGQETFLEFEDVDLEAPREPGKWSRKEIIGHLIDSALNNIQRFTRAQIPAHLENGALHVPGYAQNDWVSLAKYNQRDKIDLIELWDNLNEHILTIMRGTSSESLAVNIMIGDNEPSSLEEVFMSYVGHVKHHLTQLS